MASGFSGKGASTSLPKTPTVSALSGKHVLVTGGAGFLGRHVVEKVQARTGREVSVPRSADWDLRVAGVAERMLKEFQPDIVIHLAAQVGGIGINREKPAEFFYNNLMMGVPLLHECWKAGIEKFVSIGTVCSYPKHTPVPFKEDDLWNGYPEETNAPYGLAKKMLLVAGDAYRLQYDFNSIFLLPVNLYGPGDNFDPRSSHVIPALIKKFLEAQEQNAEKVVVWGSGTPTREFLHVADAANGIVLATERYQDSAPVNLGSNSEVSIKSLAEMLARKTGFQGKLVWDTDKPDGQPRRCLSTERAQKAFGFEASVSLEEGLDETIAWYRSKLKSPTRSG